MKNSNILLYIVGTPIGNLGDISKRAIEILQCVDYVLCEDTRVSDKLMQSIGLQKKLIVYNDHNATTVIPLVIDVMKNQNMKYALISDAGMPLISDPGHKLVNACIENDIGYTTIPGPCSVISALIMSGFPSDRFTFSGFADPKKFDEIAKINSTIIMFESPKRLLKTLQLLTCHFAGRRVAVVRELTKIFEEVVLGNTCAELIKHFTENAPRGEIVIVIEPPILSESQILQNDAKTLISSLRGKISDSELSSVISNHFNISKNAVYNFLKTI